MMLRIASLFCGLGIAATVEALNGSITPALATLPECALPCTGPAVEASDCLVLNATDTACICSEDDTINIFGSCVKTSCSMQDALLTSKTLRDACGAPVRDLGRSYTIQQIVLVTISGLTVLLRLVTKTFANGGGGMNTIGLDDITITTAYIILLPKMYLCGVLMIKAGLGRDVWTLSAGQIRDYAFYWYFAEPIYFAVASMMRISIILFFMRVFTGRGLQPTVFGGRVDLRRVILGTLAFNVAMAAAFIVAALLQCAPVSFYWNQYDGRHHAGRCVDGTALVWSNAVLGIVMDLWMLYLPLSQVAGLNLSRWRKLLVAGMFCVGFFVTVISAVRLGTLSSFKSENPTWDQFPIAVWSALEMNVGIVCACLPAMRVAVVRTLPEAVSRVSKRFSSYYRLSTTPATSSSTQHQPDAPAPPSAVTPTVTSTTTTTTTEGKGGPRHSRAVSRPPRRGWFRTKDTQKASIAPSESAGGGVPLAFVTVVDDDDLQELRNQSRQRLHPLDARRLSSVLPPSRRKMTMRDSNRVYIYAAGGGDDDSDSDRTMPDSWPGPHPGTLVRPSTFTTGRPGDGRRLTPDFFAVSYPSVQK